MEQNLSKKTRTESDLIGSREVPESALYGVQTLRGIENFRISKFHLNEYPLFIQALADSVLNYQAEHGKPEKLLMSFHGIPQPYADKGDPYADRCRITARLVANVLHLKDEEWAISFQSRFGKQEWVKPYTDVILQQWGEQKVKSVQVLSPAFSADCLETLEELAIQNKELFQHAGGGEYAYIAALNTDQAHIDLIASLVQANLDALTHTLAHR